MKKPRGFYGWKVVVSAFMGNFMATGTGFYSFNAWLVPICMAHGWSRTDINIAPTLGVMIGLITQVLYGRILRKRGARPIMMLGALVSGISFALMGMTDKLWLFYVFTGLLFISNGAFNGVVPNTAVSYWFEKKRGKAMGVAATGISISGVLIPPLAMLLLDRFGLPTMFMTIGLLTWVLVISSAAWFMKKRPEDYGMFPDGIAPEPGSQGENPEPGTLPTGHPPLAYFLKSPAFWMIGLSFGLAMMGVVGVMIQLKPRFSDIGFSDRTAMALTVLTALLGAGGKYGWGRLCDSVDERKVVAWSILFQIAGLAILISSKALIPLFVFILLFGLGMGGVMSTFPIVVAGFFGRNDFPKVYGYSSLFLLLQCGGYILMGRSFDLTGSYNTAYISFIAMNIIAIILILLAKKPKAI